MTTKQLIDEILRDFHSISPTDGAYAPARLRCLKNAQRTVNKVWTYKFWPWRIVPSATVTVLANTFSAALPADYNNLGKDGSVVVAALQRELTWTPPREILRWINGDPQFLDPPCYYSEITETPAGIRSIYVYPGPTIDRVLTIPYVRRTPVLLDSDILSGLEEIPESYHEPVIKEGTIAYEMRDEGDLRAQGQTQEFNTALIGMARDLLPGLEAGWRWPVYSGARRFYGRGTYGRWGGR